MSYTAISGTGGSLVVDVPPKVVERHKESPATTTFAYGLNREPIGCELIGTQAETRLVLEWKVLNDTQVAALQAIRAAGGLVSVYRYSGAAAVKCLFDGDPDIDPYDGPWPDKLITGADHDPTDLNARVRVVLKVME